MKKYLSRVKPLYFQVLMIIITLVSSSSYLRITLGSFAVYGLAFGVVICAITLFDGTFKKVISERLNWLLFAFCGFYLISILLCKEYGFLDNLKQLVFMGAFFYLFTMVMSVKERDEKLADLKVISWVYVVLTLVVALVSFYMYLVDFYLVGFDTETNQFYEMGILGTRLAGIYNSNTSASIFTTSFIVSAALVFDYKDCDEKRSIDRFGLAVNIINLIFELFCIILTSSRGATYSLYLAFAVFVFLFVRTKKKMGMSIIACLASVIVLIGMSSALRIGLAYLPSFFESRAPVTAVQMSFNPTVIEIEFEKSDIERDYSNDISTGRLEIWKAGLSLVKDNLFFGIPYSSLKDLGKDYFERFGIDPMYLDAGGTFHNIIVACLASSGILGFIPMAAYIGIRMAKAIKSVLIQSSFNALYVLPFVIVIMALANEMVEARILYFVNILNVMFWIMMGYLPNEKKDAA